MPQDEWRVVIPDYHPGYITWDQFLANRHRLAANRTNCEVLADGGGASRSEEPGIHNPEIHNPDRFRQVRALVLKVLRLWIPGSSLRSAPE